MTSSVRSALAGAILAVILGAGPALAATSTPPIQPVAAPALPMAFAGMSLVQAEDAAVAASPDVAAARAQRDGARGALLGARWSGLPAAFGSFTESPQGGVGPLTVSAHQTAFGVQADLTDSLLGHWPQAGQADELLRAATASEAAAEQAERVAAIRIYYAALKTAAVLAAREDALRLAQAERSAALTRFRAGDVGRIDVIRADVDVARAEADREKAAADDANARDALRAETAADSVAITVTAPGALPSMSPLAADPDAAVALALQVRPEVAAARHLVDASGRALSAARLALIPPVTVSSGYATGVDGGQRVAGAAVTAQVTMPLPFGPGARIAQASAEVAEANAHLDATKRSISLETSAAARSLVAADRAASATLRAYDAARQALDAIRLGYFGGASSGLEVAQARATFAQAQLDELSAVYDEAVAAAVFDVEVGR